MKMLVRAGIAVLAGAVASGCVVSVDSQGQIDREEKRFSLDGMPDLHLATFDGSIEIQSWDKGEVLVEIEKRGPTREAVDSLQVESSRTGDRITVEVKRPRSESFRGFGFHVSSSAKLIVNVPEKANIVARSGDGSIRLERIRGRLELRTGDGAIRVVDVGGELRLNTGDGAITVDGADGRLELETGDGGVNVEGTLSAVKMHTGDGSIVYRVVRGAAMTDDWDISTGDGSITLYLPDGFGAELDAHTGDGAIRTDLALAVDRGSDHNKRTIRGRLGAGGKRLRLNTGDGSITLRTR
jgi:Putative adhesin